MGTGIVATGLSRRFGSNQAVDGLSLRVEPGMIYALVGPDGAGKTTTMRLLCGAIRADSGEVNLAGFDLASQLEQARGTIGYLPQRFSLYGELTVSENLHFFAEVRGLPPAEWEARSREVLEFVGLAEFADRPADALSGGMKQKLGLAAAMVHRPPILLLDEPTGGVDPVTRQGFWQLLIHLLRQGVTVLLSTPYMDEASRCGRVGFLNGGRLLAEGSPAALTRAMQGRVIEVSGGPRRAIEEMARGHASVEDAQAFGEHVHLHVRAGTADEITRWLMSELPRQGIPTPGVRPIPASLEDVFIDLLRGRNESPAEEQAV
jgi:ABC-2 type transport system ATP-binding protein